MRKISFILITLFLPQMLWAGQKEVTSFIGDMTKTFLPNKAESIAELWLDEFKNDCRITEDDGYSCQVDRSKIPGINSVELLSTRIFLDFGFKVDPKIFSDKDIDQLVTALPFKKGKKWTENNFDNFHIGKVTIEMKPDKDFEQSFEGYYYFLLDKNHRIDEIGVYWRDPEAGE